MKNYLRKRIAAFGHAFRGLWDLLRHHPHAHIHALATLVVLALAVYFDLAPWEWGLLLLAIAMVWVTEALNTAIEYWTDLASPHYHPLAGKAKDMAAAAVLLASMFAVLLGILVFYPYLWQ